MEGVMSRLLRNWPRKLSALLVAIVVWIIVSQSLTETKTIADVPMRVVNLPTNKTIEGLLPNGYLSERATLTLTGSKSLMQELEQGDLEILLDASTSKSDDWIVKINKKNLVSLDPSLDLVHKVTLIKHPEFVIKLRELVKEKIPIYIKPPLGMPPTDYAFLDIWPQRLTQTLEGPKEEMERLKNKGLKFTLDLNKVSKAELDFLRETKKGNDIVTFDVPDEWKEIPIPFRNYLPLKINDPQAKNLHINFLYKQQLPLEKEIPVSVFYPVQFSETINPNTHTIQASDDIRIKDGIPLLTKPLYVRNVSKRFVEIVRDMMEIVIVAAPKSERELLQWSLEIINPKELENTYVALFLAEQNDAGNSKRWESLLRKRFSEYLQYLTLYTNKGEKLQLTNTLNDDGIIVKVKK